MAHLNCIYKNVLSLSATLTLDYLFVTVATENNEADESWSSWAMSWVPSIYPLVGEENEYSSTENITSPYKNTFHFGFYVNTFSLALKVSMLIWLLH